MSEGWAPAATSAGAACSSPSPRCPTELGAKAQVMANRLGLDQSQKADTRTDPPGKVGVQLVGEERLRKLPEVEFERAGDGVDIHLPHHHGHVPLVCTATQHNTSFSHHSLLV